MTVDAWEELLRLLDRRAFTAAEAEAALTGRGCTKSKARAAVTKARRLGLIDDRKVAEDIVERGGSGAPQGVMRVRHDLERRQVPERVAAQALAAIDDLGRCRTALTVFVERHGPPADVREVARVVGYLARRGFTEASVRQTLLEIGIDPGWHDA